jgi:predicted enzyme related to lactoylglutathione lyase
MPRVVHFELPAGDPERAVAFYSQVFGWRVQKWGDSEPYWLLTTGADDQPGINGGVFKPKGADPRLGAVNTIEVEDVDAYIGRVTAGGGEIVVPKMAVPGIGWLVYCKDTEGVIFGMMQTDAAAR